MILLLGTLGVFVWKILLAGTTWQYNDADLVTQETGLAAVVVRYGYDARGNRTSRLDGEGVRTTWTYDNRDRVTSETLANTYTTAYTYDGNGNRLTMQRPGGGQWGYTYTPANQLATVSDPESGSSSYRYDGQGHRLQHTDGLGNITQWGYDVLGRLKAIVYPGGARHSYLEYDGHGNRLSERTPNGVLIEHQYDARNRRIGSSYSSASEGSPSAVEQFSYDGNNNLLSVQEQSGGGTPVSSEYGYDTFDRLTRYQSPFGETVTYSYDANGNRTRLISSGGHASRYTYDPRNRLHSVSNRDGETTYSWRRNDQLSLIRYSHGGSSRYEYDGANRLTSLTHQAFGGDVARYTYEYDANGNRTRQVEENGQGEQVTTYTYDSADRLTGVTYPDQSASYGYDAAWNRVSETLRDLTENTLTSDKTLGYNGRNQLTSVQDSLNPALNASYSYDANGNQTGKTQGGSTTDYTFDARNHLRSITTDGSPVGSFLYDYRGLRLQKQAPAITRYTHDDQSVLFQSDASGSVTHRFEYGPDRLLSLKPATQASEFYLLDALNSPIALVRGDGTLTARYSYDAWGNKRQDTGTSSNPFGFTGHEHDEETGLIYAKARYYDPETARFLSQDPWSGDALMPPSLNKYLYAYQNPTVYVDPDGHCPRMAADSTYCYFKDLERVAFDHQIDLNSASGMREATAVQAAEDSRLADQTLTGLGVMTAPAAALGSIRAATSLYFRNPEALAIYGGEAGLFAGALISGADTPLSMPAAAIRQPVRAGVQYSQSAVEAAQRGNAGRVLAEASEMPLASGSMTGVVTEAVSAPNVVPNSAIRTEAASNIRQARDILRETRPDLTVAERNQIIKAFDLESFRVNTLSSPVTEFRYFDGLEGGAGLSGRWSTPQWLDAPADRISNLALPNNQATRAAAVTLQPGATVFHGIVAPQLKYGSNLTGGAPQTFNAAGPRAVIEELR